jgi:hypothetical protein
MKTARLVFHPLLSYRMSRRILALGLTMALVASTIFWGPLMTLVAQYNLEDAILRSGSGWLKFFLSPFSRFVFVMTLGVLGAGWTAYRCVGPLVRIEEWLGHLDHGRDPGYLRVRERDHLKDLVHQLNRLRDRIHRR